MSKSVFERGGLRAWVKGRNSGPADVFYRLAMWWRYASVPTIRPIHTMLYGALIGFYASRHTLGRMLWYTPIFQSRLEAPATRLFLYGGMPMVQGSVKIRIGADCRIGGASHIMGRNASYPIPELIVGDNCDVGWNHSIAVGRLVRLGNNVRLASRVTLSGYPGHPFDAAARARGEADTDDQVGDIILEDDVWLGQGVTVLAGVTIGRGTVVGTGSVVTKDLPPFVLAAGVPARVMRPLMQTEAKANCALSLADIADSTSLSRAS